MRVIQVAPTSFGAGGLYGGGERYPLELAAALAPHVDSRLVTFGPEERTTKYRGMEVRTLQALTHWRGHPANPLAKGLGSVLREMDIVHVHQLRSLPARLALWLATLMGRSRVLTDHGLQPRLWQRFAPALVDRFLAVSDYSQAVLGLRVPTSVVYGGADPGRFHPDPNSSRAGVLFVGRLTPHKGVDRLIRALPAATELLVAGTPGHDPNPPERDYPVDLRRMAESKPIQFLETVPDSSLPALYRSAAVLALPSVDRTCYGRPVKVSELLSLTVLEAMASGTPVVASRIGGVAEVVVHGETGFLVQPGNVPELRERLDQVLRSPKLAQRLGRQARELVIERFTWDHCAQRCLRGYAQFDPLSHAV